MWATFSNYCRIFRLQGLWNMCMLSWCTSVSPDLTVGEGSWSKGKLMWVVGGGGGMRGLPEC